MKKIIRTGVKNLIAIPLIGASASMVNALPAGTAKSIASITPGLQSVALVTHNVRPIKLRTRFRRRLKY